MDIDHRRIHFAYSTKTHNCENIAGLGRYVRQEGMPPHVRRHLLADSGQHRNLLKADVEAKFEALCMAGEIEIEPFPYLVRFSIEKYLDRQMHFR